jgi:hypothetical protein
MDLTDDGARSHHLPTLAPGIASRTHIIQPPKRWGQLFGLWQGPLPGRFPRAIEVKDHPRLPCSIQQLSGLLVGGERTTREIIEKEGAQGFDRLLGQRR